MSITGDKDGAPTKVGVAIVDLTTGLLSAISILAALHARDTTGRGQRVDASLFDTGLMLLANVGGGYLGTSEAPRRYGNGHPSIVPYRDFATADGEIALAVGNDEQFRKLADVLDRPEWKTDPRFASNPARVVNRAETEAAVQEMLLARSCDEWLATLDEAGIPAGRVNTVAEALESEHARARGSAVEVDGLRIPGTPLRLDGTPPVGARRPPRLGEHTDEVLGEWLGLAAAEVTGLRTRGVV